jgi:hypothetical protein
MTEAEWLASKIPRWMFKNLGSVPDNRKLRLLATACCRRLGSLLPPASAAALAVNERFADADATLAELARARQSADQAYSRAKRGVTRDSPRRGRSDAAWAVWTAVRQLPDDAEPDQYETRPAEWAAAAVRMVGVALNPSTRPVRPAGLEGGTKEERAIQAVILRDIFGNPFRPVALNSSWRASAAVGLARTMYESRDFAAMPILADALEEAGCDSPDMLAHCRDPNGVHVRGCWVVDLVLGKS